MMKFFGIGKYQTVALSWSQNTIWADRAATSRYAFFARYISITPKFESPAFSTSSWPTTWFLFWFISFILATGPHLKKLRQDGLK